MSSHKHVFGLVCHCGTAQVCAVSTKSYAQLFLEPSTSNSSSSRLSTTMSQYSASNFYQSYQQQNSASSDVNPYYQPYAGPQYPTAGSSSSHHQAPVPANAYEYDVGIVAQQSVYVPGAMVDKRGGAGGKVAKGGKRTTVLRKGAGKVWEDQTLLEWDSCEHP